MNAPTAQPVLATAATEHSLSLDARLGRAAGLLERAGQGFSRWSLVLILLAFGLFKFTAAEAAGIQPMAANSPLLGWLYALTSVQGVSNVIGVIELVTAALLASHRWAPRSAALGGALAMVTFVVTVSFLFTTPGVATDPEAFGFLLKDVFLFGAALVATAASARAAGREAGIR